MQIANYTALTINVQCIMKKFSIHKKKEAESEMMRRILKEHGVGDDDTLVG